MWLGRIGLGTAPLAFKPVDARQGVATIHAALDAGIRLIDTALAYTRPGIASYTESLIAKALAERDDHADVVIATKGGHRRDGDQFPIDASPEALRADCQTSLRTLGVDTIDLYQLHHVDRTVPFEESVATLGELRSEGKIAAIGLSNVDIQQIERARSITAIASVQNRLSWTHRMDLPTARFCEQHGIAFLAYMPLDGADGTRDALALRAVAERHGATTAQIQLSWLLTQAPNIVALVGASQPHTIQNSAASAAIALDATDLELLEEKNPDA